MLEMWEAMWTLLAFNDLFPESKVEQISSTESASLL
jgi:hypothetical protein